MYATAAAAVAGGTCHPGGVATDADADIDEWCAFASAHTVGPVLFSAHAEAQSCFKSVSPTLVEWIGFASGDGRGDHCKPAVSTGGSYGFTLWISLSGSGTMTLPPPTCPSEQLRATGNSRRVTATLLCVNDGTTNLISSSAVISYGGISSTECGTELNIPSGSYALRTVTLTIEDALDDVTGDGRFNQDDVDFLAGIVGTPAAQDPAYARFDRYADPADLPTIGVDDEDVMILQCFVDAGLSAGYLGDANASGSLDCNDIDVTLIQAFAGEAFPSSSYKVELDADLDGVNDGIDVDQVEIALRAVEPANFHFDESVNFFDQAAYLALFNNQDLRADIYPAGTPDGLLNFFDLSLFAHYLSNPMCP